MYRIVLVSPFRDLSLLARSAAEELGIAVEVHEGSMDQSGEVVRQCLAGPPVDVFVSRGGTAAYMASCTDIPVVSMDTGPFDIMACCLEARELSSDIAVTSYLPLTGLGLLEKVLGVSITNITFKTLADLAQKIAALAQSGHYCVVGGGPSVVYAQANGLPSVFLRTSRETVCDALVKARDLAKLRREEKAKAFRLKAILDSVYDGIIAIDETGKVEVFNRAAERILGIGAAKALGRAVKTVIPTSRLEHVLELRQPEIGEIQEIGDVRIVTNRIPVTDGRATIGAVATFQDVSGVVTAERNVRKQLTGSQFSARFTFADIVGLSPVIRERKRLAKSFAASDLTVLIYGPSGTGKELFAQSIHHASRRAAHPFVAVNCGALPTTLLESELFGYEEGAFTGARRKGKHGLFELAHGGTIFLDEVEAIPVELQGRLLRVLQEREVLRVGGESIVSVDIRVIAATNTPPKKLLAEGKIRADLFYRLNVLYLELPALADRKEDIPGLCRHFLPGALLDEAGWFKEMLPYLEKYSWPGNVRELYNFVQRLAFFRPEYGPLDARALLQAIAPNILEETAAAGAEAPRGDLRHELQRSEMAKIVAALQNSATAQEAADRLGIGRSTLWRKLKQYREKNGGPKARP
jgi:propionate catabolism operon transcriptional regulator